MTKYKGGKNGSGTYQTIINAIPFHYVYAELYAGSAAVFFNKSLASISILCDKSQGQCLKLKNAVPGDTIILNSDTTGNIALFVTFFNILHSLGFPVFCYLDPPYPFISRTYKKPIYKHEMCDVDHIALLDGVISAIFPIAISTYNNAMYSGKLAGWRLLQYQSIVRGGTRTEYLYMNYPKPVILHDYSYLGSNFRERESIQRKKNNIVSKLQNLDPSLLNAIMAEFQK